jgi:hypothetical protein
MKNPIEQLMQQTGMGNSYFSSTSRYFGLEINKITDIDGREVNYVSRRIIAQPEEFQLLEEHQVVQNDRLDNIAHQYLGDPEQFWQICDANGAMNPLELTENTDESIKITLPQGIPKNS